MAPTNLSQMLHDGTNRPKTKAAWWQQKTGEKATGLSLVDDGTNQPIANYGRRQHTTGRAPLG